MTTEQAAVLSTLADQALKLPNDDPHEVARETFNSLPDDARALLAYRGWADLLRSRLRIHRSSPADVDELGLTRISYRGVDLEARWTRLANMTLAEVEAVAADYRDRAQANNAKAARWEALALEMRRRRVLSVSRLPKKVLAGIFEDIETAHEASAA